EEVCTARYSDSNPRMDGVMMRLVVTVWKATVATAWQTATSSITITLVRRRSAISQKPFDPTGMGLSQASSPIANPAESTIRVERMMTYRRRAPGADNGPDKRAAGSGIRLSTALSTAALPEQEGDEDGGADDA